MTRVNRLIKGGAVLAASCWLVGTAASAVHADDAQQLYAKTCSGCHGPAGKGDGPAGKNLKPPLPDLGAALKGRADADIAKSIKLGGRAVGKSPMMPAYGSKLTDEQINGLVEVLKGFAPK